MGGWTQGSLRGDAEHSPGLETFRLRLWVQPVERRSSRPRALDMAKV